MGQKKRKYVVDLVITIQPVTREAPTKKAVKTLLDAILGELKYRTDLGQAWSYRIRSVDYD